MCVTSKAMPALLPAASAKPLLYQNQPIHNMLALIMVKMGLWSGCKDCWRLRRLPTTMAHYLKKPVNSQQPPTRQIGERRGRNDAPKQSSHSLPEPGFKARVSIARVVGAVCQSDLDIRSRAWSVYPGLGSCASDLVSGIDGGVLFNLFLADKMSQATSWRWRNFLMLAFSIGRRKYRHV